MRLASATYVTRHIVGHRVVLSITGEIDIATVDELEGSVNGAVGGGAAELWIDLSETTFMDSSGVHLMIETRRRLAELNRRLAIICPPGPIRRVLDLAGASGILPLFHDRSSAHHAG
jgi:anti-sigma B factor antagonist